MLFQNNNYICCLCNYKTNLKANYQLHSKTDKHLQKLNFINHLREGGAENEYKLKYYQQQQQQIGANTVKIKCNSCDFYTNSIQKLSLHTQHMRHETMSMIFQHLNYMIQQQQEHQQHISSTGISSLNPNSEPVPLCLADSNTPTLSSTATGTLSTVAATAAAASTKATANNGCNKSLLCHLCNFKADSLLEMIQHVKNIRHLQVEQFVCLQRRSEQLEAPSLGDVFKLCNKSQCNDDLTQSSSTVSDISINKTSLTCLTYLTESENDEQNEETENTSSLQNKANIAAFVTSSFRNNSGCNISTMEEEGENVVASNIPSIIYKCNNCGFFAKIKEEVESHIERTHSNMNIKDFMSIPTNPVAIQAFQAAMAAATLAAVSRAPNTTPPASPNSAHAKENAGGHHDTDNVYSITFKHEHSDTSNAEDIIGEPALECCETIEETTVENKNKKGVQCPLCQDYFTEKTALELHLMTVHSVNKDGLSRLLLLVDTSAWENEESSFVSCLHPEMSEPLLSSSAKTDSDTSTTATKLQLTSCEFLLCQQCGCSFKHEQQLLQHAQKTQHFTMQKGEYLCLAFNSVRNPCKTQYSTLTAMFSHYNDTHMRLVVSERHVYKYRCKQCSLAFKTQEKLATHTLYHTMRDATKCATCQRNFRSTQALEKHIEQTHAQIGISANNVECASPRTVSPSGSETERLFKNAIRTADKTDKFENEANRLLSPSQEMCGLSQLSGSSYNEREHSPSPSPHQQISTISALFNQHEQNTSPSELLHQIQMQQQQFQNLPALHSLQQMQQQFPQFAAALAASGMPINPVEMLNLMQFHHLISLNFMNLAPPLIFSGNSAGVAVPSSSNSTTTTNITTNSISQPSATSSTSSTSNFTPSSTTASSNVDVSSQIQQQQISPGASNSQLFNSQKRARTRITDDQLKILRAHFDINNSPSEESILEMSEKANLPMKVVKHWFRNTLFKERQRNKDSPYNFNNPPSTTLNLEEYERTGQAKVIPLAEHQPLQISSRPSSAHSIGNISEYSNQQQQQLEYKQREEVDTVRSHASSVATSTFPLDVQIKTEPTEDLTNIQSSIPVESSHGSVMTTFLKQHQQHQKLRFSTSEHLEHDLMMMSDQQLSSSAQQHEHVAAVASFYNSFETKSESGSSDIHSRPHTPNSSTTSNLYASMNDLLSQQLENIPINQMGPPKKFQFNANSNQCNVVSSTPGDRHIQAGIGGTSSGCSITNAVGAGGITVSSKLFEKHSPSAQYDNNSNSSNSSTTSSGKRANRTRFTDYQIKVLQEFFENNSYPKDSDLEYLSKLLLLSPRVIVVWFQNARQKQRKIYENQPNNSLYESEEKKTKYKLCLQKV